jgi:leucyl aminopeptidase
LATAQAIYLARDLINTPAEDMGPENLHQVTKNLAKQHGAKFTAIIGQELLAKNFPLIHAVGRAAEQEPRLLELNWGNPRHKKLTLIGKGVCFDTGGLDIKTADGMLLMKKDMGGAAHALALAHMIIARHLPVRLRVLIPAVENSISDEAFRPGDVFRARNGKSVEIGNTDAEGRLVLADALCLAAEGNPDLIVDFATLTGAARVALGPELPALFTNRETLAQSALRHSQKTQDPLWPLPLWPNYRKMLRSKIADINNSGQSAMAGAITAALFLSEFVAKETDWLHLDVYAWNLADEPGRPQGGEAMTIRALFSLLQERYKHD